MQSDRSLEQAEKVLTALFTSPMPLLIRRNDPDRGGKLAQFIADMLLNTALVSGTIVGYLWGMCK